MQVPRDQILGSIELLKFSSAQSAEFLMLSEFAFFQLYLNLVRWEHIQNPENAQ